MRPLLRQMLYAFSKRTHRLQSKLAFLLGDHTFISLKILLRC